MKTRKKTIVEGVTVSGDPPKPPEPSHPISKEEFDARAKGLPKRKPKPYVDADPMAPGRKLRTIRGDFPPVYSEKITLILFTEGWGPRFATTTTAKLELLDALPGYPKAALVAVWTGAKESHAFDVTDTIAAEWLAILTPDP